MVMLHYLLVGVAEVVLVQQEVLHPQIIQQLMVAEQVEQDYQLHYQAY